MEKKRYTELEVWKKSRELVNQIYGLTKRFPKEEVYGLTNQIRRCAISVPSNIAEGCGRQHARDSIQFFYVARGSLYELETHIYMTFDQEYISADELKLSLEKIQECRKLLQGFINYYKNL